MYEYLSQFRGDDEPELVYFDEQGYGYQVIGEVECLTCAGHGGWDRGGISGMGDPYAEWVSCPTCGGLGYATVTWLAQWVPIEIFEALIP
jgi:hypothetical protein